MGRGTCSISKEEGFSRAFLFFYFSLHSFDITYYEEEKESETFVENLNKLKKYVGEKKVLFLWIDDWGFF